MNKIKAMQWTGFALVLLVALAISGWSLVTMATNEFGMPLWLGGVVSLAFDGAAIYVAVLASEYSKTEDSGLMARLATLAFVGVSAWLNWQHAGMLGLPLAGKVFFAAPTLIAGSIFELMLKFENRKELRKRGRVAQSMPVFGRISWVRYPLKTFKAFSKVVLFRLDRVTENETGHMDTGQSDSGQKDKPEDMDTKPVSTVDKPKMTRKKVSTPTVQELEDTFTELTADMSIAKLSQALYKKGIESRPEIQSRVSAIKGEPVPLNTICKSINRLK